MNIPFLGRYGTKYGGSTGETDPGNTGSFVNPAIEDGGGVTGQNNNYGEANSFDTSCGLIFQARSCWLCGSYFSSGASHQRRRFRDLPGRRDPGSFGHGC
jgi:hypothetical protein